MRFGGEPPSRGADRIVVLDESGRESRAMTPDEFARMKLDERVRLILGKRLRFFAGGREIPMKEALADR